MTKVDLLPENYKYRAYDALSAMCQKLGFKIVRAMFDKIESKQYPNLGVFPHSTRDVIQTAKSKEDLRTALFLVYCQVETLEARLKIISDNQEAAK